MTSTTNREQRVSRLEGAYEHLATKADVERLRAEIKDAKISTILWLTGIMAGLLGAAVAFLKAWPG